MKLSKESKTDLRIIVAGTYILSLIMVVLFLVLGQFNLSVLYGAIIGSSLVNCNILLLAYSLHKFTDKLETNKGKVGLFYLFRNLLLLIGAIVSIAFIHVNPISLLVSYIFPQIIIRILQFTKYKKNEGEEVNKG